MNEIPVFVGSNYDVLKQYKGDENQYDNMIDCRIPSLLCLKNEKYKGNIIAVADRASCGADWGRIELAARLSFDNGQSFEKSKTILSLPVRKYPYNNDDWSAAFAIDAVMTETEDGKVNLLVDFYPECKGLFKKKLLEKGSGYVAVNKKNYLALYSGKSGADGVRPKKGKVFTLREDGFVYASDGRKTNYYVPKNHNPEYNFVTLGDMYYAVGEPDYVDAYPPLIPQQENGKDIYVGNIYLNKDKPKFNENKPVFVQKEKVYYKDSEELLCIETKAAPLRCAVTSYIWCMESTDGGQTFSQPFDINLQIKDKKDGTFLGTGPGVGLKLQHGKCKGRILAPLYKIGKACVIISDDNGKNWRRGKDRFCNNIDECQLIETPDGKIYCFGRPSPAGIAPLSVSEDGGETFKKLKGSGLYTPKCQKSVIAIPKELHLPDNLENDGFYILVSAPSGHKDKKDATRTDGQLYLGHIKDDVIEWLKSYDIKDKSEYQPFEKYDDFYAYSCLAILNDNSIGLLYESYPSCYIVFKKIDL